MKKEHQKILVKVGQPETEEIWELCNENHSFCPTHGECPDILDHEDSFGEVSRQLVIETMFFCKECGMVKMINVWNNCSGLTDGKLLEFL